MSFQEINIGTVANDQTGDSLRTAMQKVNDNFTTIQEAGQRSLLEFVPQNLKADIIAGTSTDDVSSSIQTALDAAASDGFRLLVNPGQFWMEALCEIDSGVEMVGVYRKSIFKCPDDLNDRMFTNADHVGGNSGIVLKNLVFDHNGLTQTAQNEPVRFVNCDSIMLERNLFKDAAWAHLTLTTVSNSRILRNESTGGHGHGIVLRTGSVGNWVEGNYIHDIGGPDGRDFGSGGVFGYGVFLYDADNANNIIARNRIVDINGHGLICGGNGDNDGYDDNRWLYNTVIRAGYANTAKGHHGIWIALGASRNKVIGNIVEQAALNGIKLNQGVYESEFKGNTVRASGTHGFQIDEADNNLIEGNFVSNSGQNTTNTYDGINVATNGASQKYNTIRGNHCYDDQGSPTQRYGIRENTDTGDSNYNVIEDNHCWGNASGPVLKSGVNTKMRRNFFRDGSGNELGTTVVTGSGTLAAYQKNVRLNLSGAATITLPTAANVPDDYEVMLVDVAGNLRTNPATIAPSSGFTIDGGSSLIMRRNGQRLIVRKVPGQLEFVTFDASSDAVWRSLADVGEAGSAHTGTTDETALATISVPGRLMGANGRLRGRASFSISGSAGTKTLRWRLGGLSGTIFSRPVVTTTIVAASLECEIRNRNSESSQIGVHPPLSYGPNATTSALATATIDTSEAQDLVITAELADAADSVTLESCEVEYLSRA